MPLVNPRFASSSRVLRTEMESGRIRSRRQFEDPVEILEVEWHFTEDQFETFKDFFDVTLVNGTLSFTIALESETEREVVFFEANYAYSSSDNLFIVNSQLELLSLPAVTMTIDIFEVEGETPSEDPSVYWEPPFIDPPPAVTLGIDIEEVV